MLFMGTLDDKTLEYPYGARANDQYPLDPKRLLLHQMLFGVAPLVLEEGFVLASQEAWSAGSANSFLISAIKSGQVRIASRNADLAAYNRERREKKHAAARDDVSGREYVAALQAACDDTAAFVEYPRGSIDEITFSRLCRLIESENLRELLALAEVDLPADFLSCYVRSYEAGNNGRRWTARAAWEAALKASFAAQPHVVHAMMVRANRERQIIRALGIAHLNDVEMTVETGLESAPHDLAESIQTTRNTIRPEDAGGAFPRVRVESLITKHERLFHSLSDPDSILSRYRALYVGCLEGEFAEGSLENLETAARDYERQIYKAIGEKPEEDEHLYNFPLGVAVGMALDSGAAAIRSYAPTPEKKAIFFPKLNRRVHRRNFFRLCLLTSVVAADYVAPAVVKGVTRTARVVMSDDTVDLLVHDTDFDGRSHQIMRVDRSRAGEIGLR